MREIIKKILLFSSVQMVAFGFSPFVTSDAADGLRFAQKSIVGYTLIIDRIIPGEAKESPVAMMTISPTEFAHYKLLKKDSLEIGAEASFFDAISENTMWGLYSGLNQGLFKISNISDEMLEDRDCSKYEDKLGEYTLRLCAAKNRAREYIQLGVLSIKFETITDVGGGEFEAYTTEVESRKVGGSVNWEGDFKCIMDIRWRDNLKIRYVLNYDVNRNWIRTTGAVFQTAGNVTPLPTYNVISREANRVKYLRFEAVWKVFFPNNQGWLLHDAATGRSLINYSPYMPHRELSSQRNSYRKQDAVRYIPLFIIGLSIFFVIRYMMKQKN